MADLVQTTRTLLERRGNITLAAIARGVGEPVRYDWLKRFASGDIPDPSVNRIQALHDYLISLPRGAV